MALQEDLTAWITRSADQIDLQLVELTWINEWLPGYTAIAADLMIEGAHYQGHGSAEEVDVAVSKAVVEAIERSVKVAVGIGTTSGLAGHISRHDAANAALRELVERDAFFCHYLTKTPFLPVSGEIDLLEVGVDFARVKTIARQRGIELQLGQLIVPDGLYGIICAAFGEGCGKTFGVILGLGCCNNRQIAAAHAIQECLRNVAGFLKGNPTTALTVAEFRRHPKPWVPEHFRLGLALASGRRLKNLFDSQKHANPVAKLELQSIQLIDISLPTTIANAPLYFTHASSQLAQRAYFGQLRSEYLNFRRLSQFCGRIMTRSDIDHYPHFLS